MKKILFVFLLLLLNACQKKTKQPVVAWSPFDQTQELIEQQKHENPRMRYKLINSKVLDKNDLWKPFEEDLAYFSEADYENLKPLILEKDIPALQAEITGSQLTYEKLTLFYIYRIRKYESDNQQSLNTIISLNPNVLNEARERDKNRNKNKLHEIYGMPILLKDNIGFAGLPTTAGSIALKNNEAPDAFITKQLKNKGALILGKANLSEWAYYLCIGCPVGYSAVGGQTLNPYGRKVFESGGSSSGSGVSVAANFAVAAVGTETSGSILSPSSQNSVVGLKPTVGLLSRTGIVPISSTLDTPGPMTRNVTDNAILLDAMTGKDSNDSSSVKSSFQLEKIVYEELAGKRFGVFKSLIESDTVYKQTVDKIKSAGAKIIELNPEQTRLSGFLTLLNIDMKHDLPAYLSSQASKNITVKNVADVVAFNLQDTLIRVPYGQQLFQGIIKDTTSGEAFDKIKIGLHKAGSEYFDDPIDAYQLDAILSINNYHAGFAAVAKHPALTVPMGYKTSGEPIGLTFIAKPFEELKLLKLGLAFEQLTHARVIPKSYQ
ncbi:MAG: amidase [Flavobacteriales bacterium CG_4_9_14_3_um_filter_40_17]|nr:MAG: amidase [Flavobacteriales bacterium CG_4_9_14_3_um_filter_40_17]